MKLFKDKKFLALIITFIALVGAAGVINLYIFLFKSWKLAGILDPSKRPARLEIIKILDQTCSDCFDIEKVLEKVKKSNITVKNERSLNRESAEAQELISKYNIERLPSFIVTGDLDRNNDLIMFWKNFGRRDENNKIFVFTRVFPPFVNAETGEVRGQISAIYLTDLSCPDCYDVTRHEIALTNLGLNIGPENSKVVDVSSSEGKALVKEYVIRYVPTVILEGGLNEYPAFLQVWPTVGSAEDDGAYIFREKGQKIMGTYKDLKTDKILNTTPISATSPTP